MSSVINFFKNKIKPFKKRTGKQQQQQQQTNCFEIESRLECTEPVIECCREKKVASMKVNTSLKVKKRITAKNMFNLKQLKKATNTTNLIQRFISSDIVIVNKDYNLNNLNNNKKETETSSVSSSFEWSSNKTELYDLDETSSMLTYNSKYNNNNNNNNNRNILETPSSTEIELDPLFVSNRRRTTTKRKKIILENQNLNRSLIDDDESVTKQMNNNVISSNKRQKCRRSNTTAATSHHHNTKSNSIIDYYNKLELINPTAKRTKTFNYSDEALNHHQLNQFESESSLVSSVNNTKNEIEKIQDLFFEDDESLNTTGDGLINKLLNEKNIITSYLDSPVSATASSGHNNDAKNNESCFFNVPASSPTSSIESRSSSTTEQDEKNKSNKSVEKLRRSVSTPGLKEINASIFSNISNIQIKECAELVVEEEEIEVVSSLTEKEGQVNIKPPQFIRGGKIRSSKNIKQLFKNVVKYQMNALNSLEKFYESQLNKLESDRKQNLNLNPVYADKINDFYDRQLSLLEERVQTNLKLICDNKRNRLSTASSSSTILVNNNNNNNNNNNELVYPVAVNNYLAKKNNQINNNNNKSVKIVSNENEKTINVSRTLNDLKLNLKNQNSLLPSKKNAYKLNDSNDVSTTTVGAAATGVDNNKSTSEIEYSKAKFFSPKIALLAQNNKFYKKQSVLQSPLPTDGRFKLETTPPLKETNQYQRHRIKRYSTSNENLAQITKVHHIKNNMARIVKLNNNNKIEQEPKILNLGFRYAKKHQSFCNLENEAIQFIEVKHENLNELIINDQFNTNNNIRMSDSHLMFELRQKKQAEHQNMYGMNYVRKTSKSFLFETNV